MTDIADPIVPQTQMHGAISSDPRHQKSGLDELRLDDHFPFLGRMQCGPTEVGKVSIKPILIDAPRVPRLRTIPESPRVVEPYSERVQLELNLKSWARDLPLGKFKFNLLEFEANAKSSGITQDRIDETYRQLNRILIAPMSAVPQELRSKFVEQWASKLADPYTVRQGRHETRGMAFAETFELVQNPDVLTRMIADALVLNQTQVPDTRRGLLDRIFPPTPGTKPKMRSLVFDPGYYRPDAEAPDQAGSQRSRNYADQVAQATLTRINWDSSEASPAGTELARQEIKRTHKALTGEDKLFLAMRDSQCLYSESGFASFLRALQSTGKMPIGAMVHPARPVIREGFLIAHPELTAVSEKTSPHVITIRELGADGMVQIHNPWGFRCTMTPAQLWEAMRLC